MDINYCRPTWPVDNLHWPPTGYEYGVTTMQPSEVPETGYSVRGPVNSESGRVFYDAEKNLFSFFYNQTQETCYLPEDGVFIIINSALLVMDGVLHIAMSRPDRSDGLWKSF